MAEYSSLTSALFTRPNGLSFLSFLPFSFSVSHTPKSLPKGWHADFGSLRKQAHLMSFDLSLWAGPTRGLHPTKISWFDTPRYRGKLCHNEKYYGKHKEKGGVWFVILNNHFQFLNNVLCISTRFFTHTYLHKCFQTTIFSF